MEWNGVYCTAMQWNAMQVEAFVASLLGGVMAGAAGRRFATLRAAEQVRVGGSL